MYKADQVLSESGSITIDAEAQRLFDKLIRANDFFRLGKILPGNVQDRMHMAASHLKKHYDLIAEGNVAAEEGNVEEGNGTEEDKVIIEGDEKFAPYWHQEKSFEASFELLLELPRRGIFTSRKKYLKSEPAVERIELCRLLDYFQPMYVDNHHKGEIGDRLQRKPNYGFSDRMLAELAPPAIGTIFGAITGEITSPGVLAMNPEIAIAIIVGYVAALPLRSYAYRQDEQEYLVKTSEKLKARAITADKAITMIHKFG